MPKSMTGFGRGSTDNAFANVVWEARSVNSRYLDLKWRLPFFLRANEPDLEKVVRQYVERGRLEVICNFQPHRPEVLDVALNKPLAQAMLRSVSDLAASMGHDFVPDYTLLLTISSLWQEGMKDAQPEILECPTARPRAAHRTHRPASSSAPLSAHRESRAFPPTASDPKAAESAPPRHSARRRPHRQASPQPSRSQPLQTWLRQWFCSQSKNPPGKLLYQLSSIRTC